jgi:hypothetical protein
MPWTLEGIFDAFGYTLSLPERAVRSLAAAMGGASKILADTLLPEPLRRTSTYAAIVGNAQRFVIEQVADVQGVYAADAASLPENYVPRKIAGNLMEAAGMFAVHLSPLWVFAFVSDLADGSKVYLNRLVDELKAHRVLPEDAGIRELDDLFDALGHAGRKSSEAFEAPPINLGELSRLREDLTRGYRGVFREAGNLLPRMDTVWKRVEAVAGRQGVGTEALVGLMTVDLGRTAGKAMDAAFAVGSATTGILGETVLKSYAETLDRVQRQGAVACIEDATKPYTAVLAEHWRSDRPTLTQKYLGQVMDLFGVGRPSADESAGAPADGAAHRADAGQCEPPAGAVP